MKYSNTRMMGAALLSAAGSLAMVQAQESTEIEEISEIEEIVITGSRLLGMESSVSPVQVIGPEEFFEHPSDSISEYLQTMITSNANRFDLSNESANNGDTRNSGNRGTTINLRGLGAQNTLILINGERTVAYPAYDRASGWQAVDINATLPSIAVGNIQILSDGGSAIYGSDAVAGVVNVVPDYDFRGADVQFRTLAHGREPGSPDSVLSLKFGSGNETTNFMVAGDFRTADFLTSHQTGIEEYYPDATGVPEIFDIRRPGSYTFARATRSGAVQTGRRGSPSPAWVADPLCGEFATLGIDPIQAGLLGDGRTPAGTPLNIAPAGRGRPAQAPAGSTSCESWPDANWRTGQIERDQSNLFATVTHDFSDRLRLTAEAGYSTREQADHYKSGGGIFSLNQPLSESGEFSMVVPSHNPAVEHYASLPGITASQQAVFTDPDGLIPDLVRYDGFGDDMVGFNNYDQTRVAADLEWQISSDWYLGLGVVRAQNESRNGVPVMHLERFSNALRGLGGPDCDPSSGSPGVGGCLYFNPFMSAGLPNADALGIANGRALLNYITPANTTVYETEFGSYSLGLTGTLGLELGGGEVGVSVGLASRTEDLTVTRSQEERSPTQLLAGIFVPALNIDSESTTDSVYAEFALPFTDRLDVQIAGRHEDNSGGFSSFDPKVGFNFRPTPDATVRGSWGTSFRAPTAIQNDANALIQERRVLLTYDPEFSDGTGPTRRANYTVSSIQVGNPDLEPESATNIQLGADLRLFDMFGWSADAGELSLSIDYINIDFEDVIRLVSNNQRLRQPECHVRAVDVDTANPALLGVASAVIELIPRNPNGLAEGECFLFVSYDPGLYDNEVSAVYGTAANLSAINSESIDIRLDYRVQTPVGMLTIRPQATYQLAMDVLQGAGQSTIDAVGTYGVDFVRPTPKWRANMPVGLRMQGDTHSILFTPRYISAVDFWQSGLDVEGISAALYFDLNYTWNVSDQLRTSLFVNNLTDEIDVHPDNPGTFLPPYGRRIGLQVGYIF